MMSPNGVMCYGTNHSSYCDRRGGVLRGANRLGVCFGETPTGDLICGFDLGEKRLDFQDVICL